VRRVECTIGRNGWHLHVHALLFVPGDETEARAAARGAAMFDAWSRRLVRDGLEAPLADSGGLSVKLLDLTSAGAEIAKYLAKGTFETAATKAALELAGSGKRAWRRNRTPMQVLADVTRLGLAEDAALWWEWEDASHGKQALTWKQGFRDTLCRDDELSDEELAAETDHGGEVVVTLSAYTWTRVRAHRGAASRLLELVEQAGAEFAEAIVTDWLRWANLPPPGGPWREASVAA
jgi:hypothetical protein